MNEEKQRLIPRDDKRRGERVIRAREDRRQKGDERERT